jgi:hypothetical protein
VCYAENVNNSVAKRFIFVSKLVILHRPHKKPFFFSKPRRGHIGHGDVHIIFFLKKITFVENAFQIKGSICFHEPKCHVRRLLTIPKFLLANFLFLISIGTFRSRCRG